MVNRGVAGIAVGQTTAKVKSVLGKPVASKTRPDHFLGRATTLTYPRLTVMLAYGRVITITTTRTTERTRRGIGVGSTEALLRSRVGGVRCETGAGVRTCSTGTFRPGTNATTFDIRSGRIWRVRVGRVID